MEAGLKVDVGGGLDGAGDAVRGGGGKGEEEDADLGPILRRNASNGAPGTSAQLGSPSALLQHGPGSFRKPRREGARRSSVANLSEPKGEDDEEIFFAQRGKVAAAPSPTKVGSPHAANARAWMAAGGSSEIFRTGRRSSDESIDSGGHDDGLPGSPIRSDSIRMGESSRKLVLNVVEQKSITSAKKVDRLRSTLAYVQGRNVSAGHEHMLQKRMSFGLPMMNVDEPQRKLTMVPPTEGDSKSLSRPMSAMSRPRRESAEVLMLEDESYFDRSWSLVSDRAGRPASGRPRPTIRDVSPEVEPSGQHSWESSPVVMRSRPSSRNGGRPLSRGGYREEASMQRPVSAMAHPVSGGNTSAGGIQRPFTAGVTRPGTALSGGSSTDFHNQVASPSASSLERPKSTGDRQLLGVESLGMSWDPAAVEASSRISYDTLPSVMSLSSTIGLSSTSGGRRPRDRQVPGASLGGTVFTGFKQGQTSWSVDCCGVELDEIPEWITNRVNTRVLALSGNHIQVLPHALSNLKVLQDLQLNGNNLRTLPEGIFPEMRHLCTLNLSNNSIIELPSDIYALDELRCLYASDNKLKSIPPIGARHQVWSKLQDLDLSGNLLETMPARIDSIRSLQKINLARNRIRHINWLHKLMLLEELDLSSNRLSDIEAQLIVLVSNEEMGVDARTGVRVLELHHNPQMRWPPPEVTRQGGEVVVDFLKSATNENMMMRNKELVLVVVGEAECGKSSLIKALTSGGGSEDVGFGGGTGATSFTSWVADTDVSFEIFDVAGSAVFSVTHQLVLMRRAVYMFVWKLRKGINGQLAEWQERELRESVTEWVDSLQHKVPGASLLIVATHTDLACSQEDLEHQVKIVQEAAREVVESHVKMQEQVVDKDGMSTQAQSDGIKLFSDGRSMCVLLTEEREEGVSQLKRSLISVSKESMYYGEKIPASILRLKKEVMLKSATSNHLSFKEYTDIAEKCNVVSKGGDDSSANLRFATVFLHDLGVLRYFGTFAGEELGAEGKGWVEGKKAGSKADASGPLKQQTSQHSLVEDTVYISLPWMIEACSFLRNSSLHCFLFEFFSSGIGPDKKHVNKQMAFRARRLMTHGVVHPSLVPFLWPNTADWPDTNPVDVHGLWAEAVSRGLLQRNSLEVVRTGRDLMRVILLLEGLDIAAFLLKRGQSMATDGGDHSGGVARFDAGGGDVLGGASLESDSKDREFVIPSMLSTSHRFRIDSRVFGSDCLFRVTMTYTSLPPGFFERLTVRLRRNASHMDFNRRSAAFYTMGTKLQVFCNPVGADEAERDGKWRMTALFSSKKMWKDFTSDLSVVEGFFPGLRKVSFEAKIATGDAETRKQFLKDTRKKLKVASASLLVAAGKRSNFFTTVDMIAQRDGFLSAGVGKDCQASMVELEERLKFVQDQISVVIIHSSSSRVFAENLIKALVEVGGKSQSGGVPVALRGPQEISARDIDHPFARVVLVCVDNEITRDQALLNEFRRRVKQNQSVIPLILPGFHIQDFARWWPSSMPEMQQFSLFMDLRGEEWRDIDWKIQIKGYYEGRSHVIDQLRNLTLLGDAWAASELSLAKGYRQLSDSDKRTLTVQTLHGDITRILEEWKGEAQTVASVDNRASRIPCVECSKEGMVSGHGYFDRAECLEAKEAFTKRSLQQRGYGTRREQLMPPTMACSKGHKMLIKDILSSGAIQDSVPCPSCLLHPENVPPWCFSRGELLTFFDEENDKRQGTMTCPKCTKLNIPPIRILEILAPEIFLSYQWGMRVEDDTMNGYYITQEIVKRYRKKIELEADVLCWLDVGGGLTKGQELLKQIEEGIEGAFVALIFLSDAYVMSENCRKEFGFISRGGKAIIPILLPPPVVKLGGRKEEVSTGWTGELAVDPQTRARNPSWWSHTQVVEEVYRSKPAAKRLEPLQWDVLSNYTPIDLRSEDLTEEGALNLAVARILEQFHRGDTANKGASKAKKLWKKISMVHKFVGGGKLGGGALSKFTLTGNKGGGGAAAHDGDDEAVGGGGGGEEDGGGSPGGGVEGGGGGEDFEETPTEYHMWGGGGALPEDEEEERLKREWREEEQRKKERKIRLRQEAEEARLAAAMAMQK